MSTQLSAELFWEDWDDDRAWEPTRQRRASPAFSGPFDVETEELAVAAPVRVRRAPVRARPQTAVPALDALIRLGPLLAVVASILLLVTILVRPGPGEGPPAPPEKRAGEAAPPPRASAEFTAKPQPIRMGDRGKGVRELQQTLAALGFGVGEADGSFAEATRDVVVAFQQANGLAADGVVGRETAAALRAALAEPAREDAAAARRGLVKAVRADRLSPESRARYETLLKRSLVRLERMQPASAAVLTLVFDHVAAHAGVYDEPRALTLFSMLEVNARHLARNAPGEKGDDIRGRDGVVYRYVPSRGFQFHPIANFAALNRLVSRRRIEEARTMAAALVVRGVPEDDTLVWEYYFPYGGPPRWTSGFAQGVAAESLARAGALVADRSFSEAARGRSARSRSGSRWTSGAARG